MSLIDTSHGEAITARISDLITKGLDTLTIKEIHSDGLITCLNDEDNLIVVDPNTVTLYLRPFLRGDKYIFKDQNKMPDDIEYFVVWNEDFGAILQSSGHAMHLNPLWRPAHD